MEFFKNDMKEGVSEQVDFVCQETIILRGIRFVGENRCSKTYKIEHGHKC